ncbi:copper resistance protein NlpE N-terminal domain-containing protein [Flavobacterium fluviatile]|uniref:copper resistance protein NlpE N-terminal domain-containing protein n=1 Tax=Flavobacterium fluviatile TaxID=1862387 RepID=UPI0013D0E67E|nr:copper resistance protein NlpE N-terminal domain-containing protein [Flavobacterium fluviatile]
MKLIIFSLLFITGLNSFAQSKDFSGEYTRSLGEEGKHLIEYKLTLNADGTFVFHYYKKIQGGTPPETNKYGKGKWNSKDNLITFTSNKNEDFDEKYTLDLNNSTARFITKNPRDKSDKVVKTKLQFLESDISWMQRIDLFKI